MNERTDYSNKDKKMQVIGSIKVWQLDSGIPLWNNSIFLSKRQGIIILGSVSTGA